MSDSPRFARLLHDLLDDFNRPDVLWQCLVLLICLGVAWGLQTLVRRRLASKDDRQGAMALGRAGVRRVVFPLSALLLVVIGRALLEGYTRVNLLNLAVPLLSSMAAIRVVMYAMRHAFGPSSWIANFEKILATTAWSVVALHILGWLPAVIGALESISFTLGAQKLTLWMMLKGVLLVLVTLLLALWLGGLVEQRLNRATAVDANLRLVLVRIAKALLMVVAVLVSLPLVGINLTTLSVFGGALGVGLGFGLQKIAANYVSGFIILLDRSIRIGNLIQVGTERGVVRQITTRYTLIRAATGVESIIPNETLVGSVVQNETLSDTVVALPLNFQIAYGDDVEKAMAILCEVARTHPRVQAEPPPSAFLVGFGDNGINLRLSCWVIDPQEGVLGITSAINLAVWHRFREEGIHFPFPQREVRLLNEAEAGTAPAASA